MTVTSQDIYLLAELRRKDPELALRIATLSATQNKVQTNAGR